MKKQVNWNNLIGRFHEVGVRLSSKLEPKHLRVFHPKQESCPRNDYRKGGWPWLCPSKAACLSPFPGEVPGWRDWSWCGCCSPAERGVGQGNQIWAACSGWGSYMGDSLDLALQIHFWWTQLRQVACVAVIIFARFEVWLIRKIYDFKHSRLPASIGNR